MSSPGQGPASGPPDPRSIRDIVCDWPRNVPENSYTTGGRPALPFITPGLPVPGPVRNDRLKLARFASASTNSLQVLMRLSFPPSNAATVTATADMSRFEPRNDGPVPSTWNPRYRAASPA